MLVLLANVAMLIASVHGNAYSFGQLEQAEFLVNHNSIRGRIGAQNMECLTSWNAALATAAATQAARCNLTAPTNETRGYSFLNSTLKLTPAQALQEHWNAYAVAYDYMQGTCDTALAPDGKCENALQMLWFEGGEFGCAGHQCGAHYVTVCAYETKRAPDSRPFALLPTLPPCTMCRSSFSVCRENLCCKLTTGPTGPTTQDTNVPAGALVDLVRLYDEKQRKNILETQKSKIDASVAAGANNLGPIGKVPTATNTSNCPVLQEIVTYSKTAPNTNVYMLSEIDKHWASSTGYVKGEAIGYAVYQNGTCGASVAVYSFYNNYLGFVQLTNRTHVNHLMANSIWKDYHYRGISFYIWA